MGNNDSIPDTDFKRQPLPSKENVPLLAQTTAHIMRPYERNIMNKLELAKTAISFVVGAGTSKIVTTIIKNNVQPENVTEQVTTVVGSVVLGSMVADASKKYIDTKIDEIATWWKENVKKD